MLTHEEKQAMLQNVVLVENLKAYLWRYESDQKRIFDIVLRTIENPPKVKDFSVSPPGSDYRARLCFIVSIICPDFIRAAADLWKADAYFIVESNKDAVAFAFQTLDLKDLIANPNFHFYLGYDGEDVIAPLQRVLRQTAYAGKLFLSQVLTPNKDEGIEDRFIAYAEHFNVLLRKTVEHVFFNFGNINDSVEGLRATFANFDRIKTSGGVTELENLYSGLPAVVIGAGPSLDYDLEILKMHQDKFIIIAVDASLKPLLAEGIRVDYVVTIERNPDAEQKVFFEGVKDVSTELVAFPVVHEDVIATWSGVTRFAYRNYAWYAYFEKHWPMGILECGGSASHFASRLALHLGCSKVYLVGCDMTIEKHPTEELYRSHCKSTAFPNWAVYKSPQEFKDSQIDYRGFYDVEANDGTKVKTHTIYHQWGKEYGNFIVAHRAEGKLISTAAKGIKVPRMPYQPLTEVVTELQPLAEGTIKHPPNLRPMSPGMNHKALLANLRGLVASFSTADQALQLMVANPTIKRPEMYETAFNIFYKKIAGDTLFTGFFVQNSAMEFFMTESKVYGVPDGPFDDEHYLQRCMTLHLLYRVVLEIGGKVVKLLETYVEAGEKAA